MKCQREREVFKQIVILQWSYCRIFAKEFMWAFPACGPQRWEFNMSIYIQTIYTPFKPVFLSARVPMWNLSANTLLTSYKLAHRWQILLLAATEGHQNCLHAAQQEQKPSLCSCNTEAYPATFDRSHLHNTPTSQQHHLGRFKLKYLFSKL